MAGCSGSRNLRDNLADLNAQIAANQKVSRAKSNLLSSKKIFQGIALLQELIESYTLPVVQAYMGHIQANAEQAVRALLKEVGNLLSSCGNEVFRR